MNRGFAKKAEVLIHNPASGACRKNEFLCANSVMLCVSVVKLPGKTFTTEARSLHREPLRNFSDRLLQTAFPKGCWTSALSVGGSTVELNLQRALACFEPTARPR